MTDRATPGLAEAVAEAPSEVLEELAQRLVGSIAWCCHPDRHEEWREDARHLWQGQIHYAWERDVARRVEQARRDALEAFAYHCRAKADEAWREPGNEAEIAGDGWYDAGTEAFNLAARPAPTPTEHPRPARDDDYGSAVGE